MAKTNKVPKKIAGVKLPKPLRRGLRDLAASQNGRKALIEALDAASTALSATQAKPTVKSGKTAKETAPNADSESEAPRSPAETRAANVAALEDATRSFTDALNRRGPPEAAPVATPPSAATH